MEIWRLPTDYWSKKNFVEWKLSFYFLFLTYIPYISIYFSIKIYLIIFTEISNLWIWNLSPLNGNCSSNYCSSIPLFLRLFPSDDFFFATVNKSTKPTQHLFDATLSTNNVCTRLIPNWLHLVYRKEAWKKGGIDKERRDVNVLFEWLRPNGFPSQ